MSSSSLLSNLELSDTKVYAPQIRARLGTAAHLCEVCVLTLGDEAIEGVGVLPAQLLGVHLLGGHFDASRHVHPLQIVHLETWGAALQKSCFTEREDVCACARDIGRGRKGDEVCTWSGVKGYLAHKKQPLPPRTTI